MPRCLDAFFLLFPVHLAVLMPIYNERPLLERSLRRLLDTPPPLLPQPPGPPTADFQLTRCRRTLILINDASTDGTHDLLTTLAADPAIAPFVRVAHHSVNMGKGAAIATGLAQAKEIAADLILIHDADLEYDPADHHDILAPILDGRADAVIGSRFIGSTHRVLYYWHSVANRLITLLSNMLTDLNLSDIECCSKAFTAPVANQLTIEEPRFGLEPELVAKLSKMRLPDPDQGRDTSRRLRIFEVPVSYAGRTYAEGKKITWRDGIRALIAILKYNLLR